MASNSHQSKPPRFPLFRTLIERTLENWPALQLAVHQGQGGSYGPEIALWMVGVVEDFFYQNDKLIGDEVAEFIETIMDQELDTAVQDGSLDDIGESLASAFQNLVSDRESEVISVISRLEEAAAQGKTNGGPSWLKAPPSTPENGDDDTKSSDEEMDTSEVAASEPNSANPSSGRRSGQMHMSAPDEDGWVTVQKPKHR